MKLCRCVFNYNHHLQPTMVIQFDTRANKQWVLFGCMQICLVLDIFCSSPVFGFQHVQLDFKQLSGQDSHVSLLINQGYNCSKITNLYCPFNHHSCHGIAQQQDLIQVKIVWCLHNVRLQLRNLHVYVFAKNTEKNPQNTSQSSPVNHWNKGLGQLYS